MDYRCPQCKRTLAVRKLYFQDISACRRCGQKVVLGDFFAFALAALAMPVTSLSALYLLSHEFEEYYVAAGYAVALGMLAGILVLVLLGRATPFRGRRRSRARLPDAAAQAWAETHLLPRDSSRTGRAH
jgi:uncharacterized membrane protein